MANMEYNAQNTDYVHNLTFWLVNVEYDPRITEIANYFRDCASDSDDLEIADVKVGDPTIVVSPSFDVPQIIVRGSR